MVEPCRVSVRNFETQAQSKRAGDAVRVPCLTYYRETLVKSIQKLLGELDRGGVNSIWRNALNAWLRTLAVGWDIGRV